ncbi:O-methyltransferase [Aureococcus anophagefferens]|nr:O-methyltransferase [Aureococcus anophagefferens]
MCEGPTVVKEQHRAKEQASSIFGIRAAETVARAALPETLAEIEAPVPDTPSERLAALIDEAKTRAADWKAHHAAGETKFLFSDCWTTDVVEAKTLAMFAAMLKARRIDVKIGDALANLKAWPADKKFDMVFVDADKGSYQAYYDTRPNLSSSRRRRRAVEVASDAVVSGVGNKPILDRALDGKAALVTGAGQIGRAFAHALAEAGAAVCVADLDLDRAKAVARELEAKALRRSAQGRLRRPGGDRVHGRHGRREFGAIDIAVNNAGVNKNSAAEDTPLSDWDLTFNLNTRGVFLCCQAEAKHMLAKGCGKIINTASMASLLVPHPQKQAAYNAKAASSSSRRASRASGPAGASTSTA